MPTYRVWYRDIAEPLEFVTAGRCSDREIVEHILAHDHLAQGRDPSSAPGVQELIARNNLAPVRYTEDESELNTIK